MGEALSVYLAQPTGHDGLGYECERIPLETGATLDCRTCLRRDFFHSDGRESVRLRLRQPSNLKSVRHHYCAGTNTVIIDARHRLILMVVLTSIIFGNSSLYGFQLQLIEFRKGELLGVEQLKDQRLAIIAQGVQNRVYITTAALSPDSSEIEVPKGPRLYVDRPVMSLSTAAFESNLYLGLILHNGNAERIFSGRFEDSLEFRLFKCQQTHWEKVLSCDLSADKEGDVGAPADLSLDGLSDALRFTIVRHNRKSMSVSLFELREAAPLPQLNTISKSIQSASLLSVKTAGDSLAFCSVSDIEGKSMASIYMSFGNASFTASEVLTHLTGRCFATTMTSGESVFAFVDKSESKVEIFYFPNPASAIERSRKVIRIDSELLDVALRTGKAALLLKERNVLRVRNIDLKTLELQDEDVRELEVGAQKPIFSKFDSSLLHLQWQDMKPSPNDSNMLIDSILQIPKK